MSTIRYYPGEPKEYTFRQIIDSLNRSTGGSDYVDGADYNLLPDTGIDITTQLQTALRAANTAGKLLLVEPGEYIYTTNFEVKQSLNAFGMVCLGGEAHFKFTGANLNSVSISVTRPDGSPAGSYVRGFKLHGCKFTQPNRADTGLKNDAPEGGSALRLTYVENVNITHCKFEHLYGSAMVLRHVRNVWLARNKISDIFKDGFHITGESSNIWRVENEVEAGGDDAFPIVGYTNLTEKPRYIYDIDNRVRGVRFARAFAYVGCSHVFNSGSYVDGKMPSYIPQQFGPDASLYLLNTCCALYIAAETFGATPSEKTYGNEFIKVVGFQAENIAPGVSTTGVLTTGYEAITVFGSNAANEDLDIQANIRNLGGRGFVCSGAYETRRIKLDLVVENNRDPLGLASLTGTPNTITNRNAAEFQRARDVDLKLRCKNIAAGAVFGDANCAGYFKADVTFQDVNQFTGANWQVVRVESTALLGADVRLTNTAAMPTTGAGSCLYGLVDIFGSAGHRKVFLMGENTPCGGVGGFGQRQLTSGASGTKTLPASPATYINVSEGTEGVVQVPVSNAMNISAVSLLRGLHLVPVTSVTGTTVVIAGDFTDRYTTSTANCAFVDSRGFVLASAQTPTNSAYASRSTTLTFASVPAETAYVVQLQTPVAQTGRANAPQMIARGSGLTMTYSGGVDVKVFRSEV